MDGQWGWMPLLVWLPKRSPGEASRDVLETDAIYYLTWAP